MILKLLQRVMQEAKGKDEISKPPLERVPLPSNGAKLVDVAHEVLSKEGLAKSLALRDLTRHGWPYVQRQRFQEKIKKKVRQFLGFRLSPEDTSEVVDEVTERIAEAAEADDHYRRWCDFS